jgi:hypothetical protein
MNATYLDNIENQRQNTETGYAMRNAYTSNTLNMRRGTRDDLAETLRMRDEDIQEIQQKLQDLNPRGTSTHPILTTISLTNELHRLRTLKSHIQDDLHNANERLTQITNERNNERIAYENRINHLAYLRFSHIFAEQNITP